MLCPFGGLATWHSAQVGLSPLLLLSTLGSAYVRFCLLGSQSNWVCVYLNSIYIGSRATRHSAQVGLCILLIQSTLGSAHLWFFLLGSQSIWVVVFLEIVYFGVLLHDNLPKWDCVNYLFSQLCILLMFGSVYLGLYLPGCLFIWSRSFWELSNMTFCSFGVCPLMVLPTLDSAQIWFCLLGIMFMKEYFYLRSCTLGILFTWVFDYLYSVHLGVCPHDSQSTKLSAYDKVFQISSGSPLVLYTFESVQLGVYLPGFCTLWSLATWHSFQVGLCPLLVLSTLDCAHFWFCLLGSQSTCVVVYLESVHLGVWPHDILPT